MCFRISSLLHESIFQMWPAGIKCSPPPNSFPVWGKTRDQLLTTLLTDEHIKPTAIQCAYVYCQLWVWNNLSLFLRRKVITLSVWWAISECLFNHYGTTNYEIWHSQIKCYLFCLLQATATHSWWVSGLKPAVLKWLPGCCTTGVPPAAANHSGQLSYDLIQGRYCSPWYCTQARWGCHNTVDNKAGR